MRLPLSSVWSIGLAISIHVASPCAVAQQENVNGAMMGRNEPAPEDKRPFNARDLSGVWRGALYGYAQKGPDLTAEGQGRFDANRPSYGIPADSPQARTRTDVHIGRRRAVPPAVGNDPVGRCNPLGLARMILYAPSPFEVIQLPTRLLQRFEWTWDHREVWADGRPLPNVDDYLPRWNGYSVGRWEGNEFVVETVGLDDRQWMDHYGYPISDQARLIERWRRVSFSAMEIRMILVDPLLYSSPWESDVSRYRLVETEVAPSVWNALVEDKCVPLDNDAFVEGAVKPAAGL